MFLNPSEKLYSLIENLKKVLEGLSFKALSDLKNKINQVKNDLAKLEESNKQIPELINSTNLLRFNEFLTKTNTKKTELLSLYELYFIEIENILVEIKKIRIELKNSLKPKSKKPSKKRKRRKKLAKKRKLSKKKH